MRIPVEERRVKAMKKELNATKARLEERNRLSGAD